MADQVALPSGHGGMVQVGYGSSLVGLGEGSTGYGSGQLALNGHTVAAPVSVKMLAGSLGSNRVPIELHFRYMDGTTQVAGEFATSLDGVTDLATVSRRVDASGYAVFACYDLWTQNGTIYMGCDVDPGADGFVDYFIVYGRKP